MNPAMFGVPAITQKIKKRRNPKILVNDEQRLEVLILVDEFNLSCYQASKVLKITYTNTKLIYRTFRKEKRIAQKTNTE